MSLGLYLHIPYCFSKCRYCDFYSAPGQRGVPPEYPDALLRELHRFAPDAPLRPDTIYFGGGTPSLLTPDDVARLMEAAQPRPGAEITLEANPESAGDWKALKALRKAGFNRLSLGMQSASDAELQHIGRVHTMAQVTAAVEAARKARFENLSLDLIYGLPGQSAEQWQENLSAAVSLAPEHLSCYGLKVEPGTPLYARQTEEDLPDDEAQADMYLYTVEYLAQNGYAQYEISNFARPGRESRHNLKYWTLQEYAGFGPGAHSDFGGVRYAYEKDLEGYIHGVKHHMPLLSESERIPPLDRDTEWLMLGLRTVQGLDPREFETRFRRRFDCFLPFLAECSRAGYAVEEDGRWHLTPKGFLVSNRIIGGMLDALAAEKRRRAEATARGDFRVHLD